MASHADSVPSFVADIGLRGLERICSTDDSGPADVHGISRRQGFGSLEKLLSQFDADVVVLQEVCTAIDTMVE